MKKKLMTAAMLCLLTLMSGTVLAQPASFKKNKGQTTQQNGKAATKTNANNALTVRAQISFPTSQQMKEDVVWRRDIYREIDLTKGDNAGLYYPVEPMGSQMNLFTYLFKLVLSGQVKAYEYRLDGNESFEADALIKPLALLDNYRIYYEKKDGRLKLDNSDIPSREVKSYYIKESCYYDQGTATFHTKVVALCPIMFREDDFGDGAARYPLFWVKYDDCAPFLSKQTIMTSDINNAATMSVDDYFVRNKYNGKIYKTNNMLGQTLAQVVAARAADADSAGVDSAMRAEQNRIEKELIDFEKNIWHDQARQDSLDSIAKREAQEPKAKKKSAARTSRRGSSSATEKKETTVSKKNSSTRSSSSSGSSGSGAARVSVRRQRH